MDECAGRAGRNECNEWMSAQDASIVNRPYTYMAYPEPLIIPRIYKLDNVLKDDLINNIYPYLDYKDTGEYRKLIIRY